MRKITLTLLTLFSVLSIMTSTANEKHCKNTCCKEKCNKESKCCAHKSDTLSKPKM